MDSTEKLKKFLEQFCPLPERDWELFRGKLQRRVFGRKERILRAGEVENFVSFIDRGIIRYFVEEGEKDLTFEIAFENSLASGYDSFITQLPVNYTAEALADSHR